MSWLWPWIFVSITFLLLPAHSISIPFYKKIVIVLLAEYEMDGSIVLTPDVEIIAQWKLAGIVINGVSIIYLLVSICLKFLSERDSVSTAEFFTAIICGFILVGSGYYVIYMNSSNWYLDYTVLVFVTYSFYCISDAFGLVNTRGDVSRSLEYRCSFFGIDLPAFLILGLILYLRFGIDFDRDKLVFLSSGQMIVTSIVYVFTRPYIVKPAVNRMSPKST